MDRLSKKVNSQRVIGLRNRFLRGQKGMVKDRKSMDVGRGLVCERYF